MKRTLAWVCVLALLVALTACQPPVSPPLGEAEGDAAAKATALIDAVLEGRATGDFGAVETILQQDDAQGELRQVLAEGGAFGRAEARSVEQPVQLPPLDSGLYDSGDVLVCRGSGTLTSNLMDLVLVNGYAHAGILNLEALRYGGTECILSADLDYLAEGQGEALNYESYLDWAVKNDVITLLHSPVDPGLMSGLIAGVAGIAEAHDTIYAFLGYPGAVVGAFQPIPRGNDDYWYCSKVPARVYDRLLTGPIEDAAFHWEPYGSGMRWNVVQQSLLYKVFLCYLKLLHPWKSLAWRVNQANLAVQGVLAELVTPDELRASPKLTRAFSVTPYGPINPEQEAALLGWGSTLY